jgi:hypothetical protein
MVEYQQSDIGGTNHFHSPDGNDALASLDLINELGLIMLAESGRTEHQRKHSPCKHTTLTTRLHNNEVEMTIFR